MINSEVNDIAKPAPLSWFTRTTFRYTPQLVELMVTSVILRLLGLIHPFVLQAVIDRILPFQRETTLIFIVVLLLVAAFFTASLDALRTYLGIHMSFQLVQEMAKRIFTHVLHLPLRWLQRWQVGETLARIGEIDTIRNFLTGTVADTVLNVVFAIIYIAALLFISPFLTLVVLAILPFQILVLTLMGPMIRRRMQDAFAAGSKHQARLVEAFGSAITIKALASENIQTQRFNESLGFAAASDFRVSKLHILNNFASGLLGNMSSVLTLFFGATLVLRNEITLGEFMAFTMLAGNVSGPIMSLSSLWEKWQDLRISRLRLGDFLNVKAEIDEIKPDINVQPGPSLLLENLSFSYQSEDPVLNDFNLKIKPGRITVMVGDSGCGKSTLAKLVCGLYVPDKGRVFADANCLSDFSPGSVRRAIAYLPQQPMLLAGSILSNLQMAVPDATEEDVTWALAQSGNSASFIAQLTDGIHTEVGEYGSRLSGGQRQRIALARALLTKPAALILDEPTSALDLHSAQAIAQALRELALERTIVVITHNPELFGEDVNLIDLNYPDRYRSAA